MTRIIAALLLAATVSGCVFGPLDPMCYPQSCIVWLFTHENDEDAPELPKGEQPDRR